MEREDLEALLLDTNLELVDGLIAFDDLAGEARVAASQGLHAFLGGFLDSLAEVEDFALQVFEVSIEMNGHRLSPQRACVP